jgi:hypothetical protein
LSDDEIGMMRLDRVLAFSVWTTSSLRSRLTSRHWSDLEVRRLRPDLERRPLDVAFPDPPVEHLPEQHQGVVDRHRRPADLPPRFPPRLDGAQGDAGHRLGTEHEGRIRSGQDEVYVARDQLVMVHHPETRVPRTALLEQN